MITIKMNASKKTSVNSRPVHYRIAKTVTLCGAQDPAQSESISEVTCVACKEELAKSPL